MTRPAPTSVEIDPAVVAFCARLADHIFRDHLFYGRMEVLRRDYISGDRPSSRLYAELSQLFLSAAPSDRSDA